MNDNPFYRLAPFIKEFIYKNRWDTLREAQVDACRVLFDTPHHLLIASGTASGKTEAAFFPALTEPAPASVCFCRHSVYRAAEGADQRPVHAAERPAA